MRNRGSEKQEADLIDRAAVEMLEQKQQGRSRRITVGADKAYDSEDFVRTVRELNVTLHVTRNDKGRKSNPDRRTTRHGGYAIVRAHRFHAALHRSVAVILVSSVPGRP